MTRREKNTRVKQILRVHGIKARVELGRGTAYHWITIITPGDVPQRVQDKIEAQLDEEKLSASYYSDCGPGSDRPSACVSWRRE